MRISDWSSDVCSSDLTWNRVNNCQQHRDNSHAGTDVAAVAVEGRLPALALHLRGDSASNSIRAGAVRHVDYAVVRPRSEERRVGKEGVRTCRSRGAPYH